MGNESVLDQLIHIERDEIAKYCAGMSVNGTIAQTASVTLNKGQTLWASNGGLLSFTDGVAWQLKVPGGAGKALGRMISGEGAALTYVTSRRDGSQVVLSANQPGRLATWDLSRGPITCTSGAFVAALGDVDISVTTAKSMGGMMFGGAGLFLQKLSGTGIAVVHGAGDFIEHQLGDGERLLVSTGNLAIFSSECGYGVRSVAGCRNMFFGGEGLFMTEITGPGWVMLQSLKKLPVPSKRGRG
ncbi:MAG: TIGR00266 family protein [Rhodobacterales bacterium]|nr:TIGR00266 family protein [Rhodobacterales bacterium]